MRRGEIRRDGDSTDIQNRSRRAVSGSVARISNWLAERLKSTGRTNSLGIYHSGGQTHGNSGASTDECRGCNASHAPWTVNEL